MYCLIFLHERLAFELAIAAHVYNTIHSDTQISNQRLPHGEIDATAASADDEVTCHPSCAYTIRRGGRMQRYCLPRASQRHKYSSRAAVVAPMTSRPSCTARTHHSTGLATMICSPIMRPGHQMGTWATTQDVKPFWGTNSVRNGQSSPDNVNAPRTPFDSACSPTCTPSAHAWWVRCITCSKRHSDTVSDSMLHIQPSCLWPPIPHVRSQK